MINIIRFKAIACLVLGLLLTGCASTKTNNQNGPYDPLEPMNRAVFNFNEMVYDNVFDPVARGYKKVTPDPIELVVGNFFSNLNDVVVITNSVLQLNYKSALASSTRLLINTTFGIFGLIDIASDLSAASDINLNKRNEDFGQTLGHYGIGSGPYIVLPLLGPSSARDTFGIAVDGFFIDPVTQGVTGVFMKDVAYLNTTALRLPVATARTINARAQFLDDDKTLEEAALDKYEFTRDAYLQRRTSLVNNSSEAK
ncbi:MAG: VacJ family lipoprotein [Nitrosomonas sp.]|uniref:MlaA family lipoprotein n=1 Tax=Nitrosomonas sp. TaxID=42353 RepID=UPI0027190525|nr:VacJ family lipoprotein [Nitrosomonas sp.]MDO9469665.1 VacJ family lipoprotein [Nitrosomonas sp.]MDP1788028.1 VacJ family lipoprotein [Nitrosomonas sp.]MDP2224415.1 VacJ family lipoprotein [Nitrosomonas sp.]MDP3279553.1 VacJ family lipoprotein [Nitrosomonas sp.]MDP3662133.1 VacJ family lipoprotein [Nitrosomonas sp.]